ncbi:MAG: hypothetical protein R2815_05600 [Flavobacteriales bacterium]|nr:hypothetical protein [Flavobacteriales bacterium]
MATHEHIIRSIGLSATLLLFCTTKATPPVPPIAQETVILTGWLHVEDLSMKDVQLEVVVNGSSRFNAISETGRFVVELPTDTKALLRFEKPGHLTKEVIVDTHNSKDGEVGQHTRRLKLAVIMQLEKHMGGQTYAGPVGAIAFDEGGGCVAITHDRALVPTRRQKPMEF